MKFREVMNIDRDKAISCETKKTGTKNTSTGHLNTYINAFETKNHSSETLQMAYPHSIEAHRSTRLVKKKFHFKTTYSFWTSNHYRVSQSEPSLLFQIPSDFLILRLLEKIQRQTFFFLTESLVERRRTEKKN